ncbi:helix-turn-helix domain-containing protein [Streptomyces alkaliphilus]|uniref:Helix-turn-helix domain-containing protein n=1 Tax=Streptomyces alkaliphilus TaxID=1472722 RepID=A0A7W3Y0F6_9ACTN|nr:helix-turn-helix domain-containing protein [Streptomyces alkaliphilus]
MPDLVWSDPAVRQAIAICDFGEASVLIRRKAGLRQSDLARLTGLSQSFLSMLESGARRLTSIDKVTRFLRGAGAPDALFPLPSSSAPERPEAAVTAVTAPAAPSEPRGTEAPTADLHGLAVRAASRSLSFTESMSAGCVGEDDLESLAYDIAAIATDYVHTPLPPLFTDLLATRDRAFSLLECRQPPRQTRELFLLAGTSCLLLAHASQNLGAPRPAMDQIRAAWTCAQLADHPGLQAWTKGTAALIAEWSPHKPAALKHIRQATALAPPGETRIRTAAITARAAARVGDRETALAALDELRRAREEQPRVDEFTQIGGLLTFPEAKQEYYIGSTYALLGEFAPAERHASRAVALYEHGSPEDRSYGDEALARVDIVTARLGMGDPDSGSDHLERLLRMPTGLRIRQIGVAMRRVGTLLQQPRLAGNRTARELADAVRGFQAIDTARRVPLP